MQQSPVRPPVTFGFQRNPDVAEEGRGGAEAGPAVVIDYQWPQEAGTDASDQRRSTRYGVKTDSGGPCRKTQRERGEENIEVILVLRNTSTGCRLLNTTEAEQGRWG